MPKGNKHWNWQGGKEKNKEYQKEYHRKYEIQWIEKNKERRREISRNYEKRKSKDVKHRIDNNMRYNIWGALKGKKVDRRWETLVGYTTKGLMEYLENLFDNKMNWDNYGSYWEIDHKKPKSLFKYNSAEEPEFKKCWALENLQPLEAGENRRKYNHFAIDKGLYEIIK